MNGSQRNANDEKNEKKSKRPTTLRRQIFLETTLLCAGILLAAGVAAAVLLRVCGIVPAEKSGLLWLLTGAVLFGAFLVACPLAYQAAASLTRPLRHVNRKDSQQEPVYAELAPLLQQIEQQDQQLLKQMQNLTVEHERQDAMRRDFTANISHELKTPLTSISGYAEIIKSGIARSEDIPRFAEKICEESRRLITLVGDIIRLTQLDGKDFPTARQTLDLYAVCETVLAQLEMEASRRHLQMSLTGEHLQIQGIGQVAEEIVFNLVDNAVKYNRDGGQVNIRLRQCVDGVELTVSDTGIGIPQEDQEHVFERFYRVDKSHSKEIGGTGLGLSIVKHGALCLGASVSLTSTLGKGTTVRILF